MKHDFLLVILLFSTNFLFAQIPNPGFELWTLEPIPVDWKVNSHPQTLPPWDPYVVRQDADAYTGNYCTNLYTNGFFKPQTWTTFPVSTYPVKLRFRGKVSFAPCINDHGWQQDTVSAKVQLLYNGTVVDSGSWSYTGVGIANYQLIEVLLTGNASTWDSCRIFLEGGNVFGGCGIIAAATEFRVDEVEIISRCTAGFYFNKIVDTVNFIGYSNHVTITSWLWDFDDFNYDSAPNPQHIYQTDGWYYPCLTVEGLDSTGNFCTTTYCDSILITHGCIDSSQICPPGSLCCDAPLYMPVCGCDSITYGNACIAIYWNGVTNFSEGSCLVTKTTENNFVSSFVLFPNPANNFVDLNFPLTESAGVVINVKNILGTTLLSNVLQTNTNRWNASRVNLQFLPSGIYFIEVQREGENIFSGRVVKQ